MRASTVARTLALTACASMGAGGARAFEDHLFVVTGDGFAPGDCAALSLDPPWTAETGLEPVGPSPIARHFLGLDWVVDTSPGGEIQAIDPETFDTVARFTVGGSPRDILVSEVDRAWVTRHDSPWLLEVDPATGAAVDSVDLGLFADSDGVPEMMMMARDGDRLFVQVQRINFVDQPPFLPGLLAVVDLASRTVVDTDPVAPGVQAIALAGMWPQHRMQVDAEARRLYVSCPGPRLDVSGGIEEIDLDSLTRLGFLLTEESVGADVGGFVLVSPTKGYYVGHTDIIPSSHLTSFLRADGQRLQEVYTGLGYVTENLAFDAASGQLFFPEQSAFGIHVFDVATDTRLTTTPVGTGTAPIDLVVVRDDTVGAPPGSGEGPLAVAFPNPSPGAVTIRLARPARRVQAVLLDVRGAIVRTLEGPPLRWDGRDESGARAPAGVYFYRLRGDVEDAGRVVILR